MVGGSFWLEKGILVIGSSLECENSTLIDDYINEGAAFGKCSWINIKDSDPITLAADSNIACRAFPDIPWN